MDKVIDYPITRLCNEGIRLRTNAWANMYRIAPQAWEAAPDVQRPALLAMARSMSNDYAQAFQEWREHRAYCPQCQEATQP